MNPLIFILVLGIVAWSLVGIVWLVMAATFVFGLAICAGRKVVGRFRAGGGVEGNALAELRDVDPQRIAARGIAGIKPGSPARSIFDLNPKLLLACLAVCLAGCDSFEKPTTTVRKRGNYQIERVGTNYQIRFTPLDQIVGTTHALTSEAEAESIIRLMIALVPEDN